MGSLADAGDGDEGTDFFDEEAAGVEDAGGEGDGVVVDVGLVGVDVFAEEEGVVVAVAAEDEGVGGGEGACVEFAEEAVGAGGEGPVFDEFVAFVVEAEGVGVVGADGLERPVGVVGQEGFFGGEDDDVACLGWVALAGGSAF